MLSDHIPNKTLRIATRVGIWTIIWLTLVLLLPTFFNYLLGWICALAYVSLFPSSYQIKLE